MHLLIISFCIILLVVLITKLKVNAFLAFLVIAIIAGILLGMDIDTIIVSIRKGIGQLLGSLLIIIVSGAMLGKLVAESGAAQQITNGMMKVFGTRYIQWALMATGFVIGIPLFYNVGFVLAVPLVFAVAYQNKIPVVFLGISMLASLSVTHGFLPPHPAPTALVGQFHADIGKTLLYGIMIAIPTVILAGPIFASTLKKIKSQPLETFNPPSLPQDQLPGLSNSLISALLPVLLLATTAICQPMLPSEGNLKKFISFISDADIVMLLSLIVATFTLGIGRKMSAAKIMNAYHEAVKDVALILLIVAGSGALKEILIDSGVGNEIAMSVQSFNLNPLLLGWLIAVIIRVSIGSATVAGLTAAGIIAPVLTATHTNPNLMVLAVGAGSLMFSHVNDAGFWLYKEYFNLSMKDTFLSWSLMETIVSIGGLIGVFILEAFI
ncbi:MAG: gluconate transporter [Bacteroidetes bacterium]|nr:gluconate transporter [Bacteroidota bacterium]